jgi:DNA anti-recombination protein RmuC
MEDLRKQANDLLVFYGKMQNRLSQAGVNDTGSLVSMFKQLERGLEAVALEELDPALQEVSRLIESLNRMQGDLQVLRDLKLRVEKTKAVLGGNGRFDDAPGPLTNGRRAA